MKIVIQAYGVVLGLGIITASCGIEIPQEFQQSDNQAATEDDAFADMYQLSDNSEYAESEELGEESQETIKAIRAYERSLHKLIADCAGFGTEAAAFAAKREELVASGVEREDLREALQADHEVLKSVMDGLREEIRSCKEEYKDSDEVVLFRSTIEACWDKPEKNSRSGKRSKKGKRGFGLQVPEGKGPKGKPHGLPPKEFSKFDTVECQEAVSALGAEG